MTKVKIGQRWIFDNRTLVGILDIENFVVTGKRLQIFYGDSKLAKIGTISKWYTMPIENNRMSDVSAWTYLKGQDIK